MPMSEHIVKILEANFITHDVKRFLIEKPKGYTFIPGQATDVAINKEGWQEKKRPMTFTGLNKWEHLELMVKIYPTHNGVTKELGKANAGDELIIHDVFGAIKYNGPGVFLAAGSGITPFVAILRELAKNKQIGSNKLIYSNRTSEDVIIGQELTDMLKDNFVSVYTRENVVGFLDKHIGRDFIIQNIQDFSKPFYICGPDKFVADMVKILVDLGAKMEALVIEH